MVKKDNLHIVYYIKFYLCPTETRDGFEILRVFEIRISESDCRL